MRDPEERPLIEIPLYQEDFYEEVPDTSSEIEAVCQYETISETVTARPSDRFKKPRGSSPPPPVFLSSTLSKSTKIGLETIKGALMSQLKSIFTKLNCDEEGSKVRSYPNGPQFMSLKKSRSTTEVTRLTITLAQLGEIKAERTHRRSRSNAMVQTSIPFQLIRVPKKQLRRTLQNR